MNIQLIHNNDLDLDRWDSMVQNAPNTRVYAESWYLDILHPDWYGLVYGNYAYVMPVIVNRKWGITYLYQPTFAQQHGIFPPATAQITAEILLFLRERYPYINLSFNSMNVQVGDPFVVQEKKNFLMSLNASYELLKKNYNQHTRRYLKKASTQCTVMKNIAPETFLVLKQAHGHKGLSKENLAKLKLILFKATTLHRGEIYGAYSQHNELVAAAFFLTDQKRITYLNAVSTDEGKETHAMMAVIDRFVADHAESSYLLDFEGSNIPGVARFFEGFGAKAESYQHLRYNALPWYLKLLKH
jgi:hypothetical protein